MIRDALRSQIRYCHLLTADVETMPLKKWSSAQVVAWAEENCPDVVPTLKKEECGGATLAGLMKEDFERFFGAMKGAAFYGHLLGAHAAQAFP